MEERYPKRNPDIVDRKEEKEALLFNPADGYMMCMNSTAVYIWDLCDGSISVADIVKKITDEFDVSREKARADCEDFLARLDKNGFILDKI